MNYDPRIPVDSAVLPGVRFVLKRMSVTRRAKFNLALSKHSARLREIRRERQPLDEEYRAAMEKAQAATEPEIQKLVASGVPRAAAEKQVPLGKIDFPDEKYQRWAELMGEERQFDNDVIAPEAVRVCLDSIEGYEIRGKIPTADELITEGLSELTDEIAKACSWVMQLTPEQQGNLRWPGISAPREAGPQMEPINATDAGPTSSTVATVPGMPPSV